MKPPNCIKHSVKLKGVTSTLLLLIVLHSGCRSRGPHDFYELFKDSEFVDFQVDIGNKFKFLHYNLRGPEFTTLYCEGSYTTIGNRVYLAMPEPFDNRNASATCNSLFDDKIGKKIRIKIATKISDDFLNEYKTILGFDSNKLVFFGVGVDTLLDKFASDSITVELVLRERLWGGDPKPSFRTITSRKIAIDKDKFNTFLVSVPITKLFFYYQTPGEMKIEDIDGYYIINNNDRKISKGKFIQ